MSAAGPAAVTATLRALLQPATATIPGSRVTMQPPSVAEPIQEGINVFLFQVSPGRHQRNHALPVRRPDGAVLQRPSHAVELSYLVTFYGDHAKLVPERLLGQALALMSAQPVLTADFVASALESTGFTDLAAALAESERDHQPPHLTLTVAPLAADALRQLWSVLFAPQPYRLSMVVQVSGVLVAAAVPPPEVLPTVDVELSKDPAS